MPSKRHGYLTRKKWLTVRLSVQRGKAGYKHFATTRQWVIDALTAEIWAHIEARAPIPYTHDGMKYVAAALNATMQGMDMQAHADKAFSYFLESTPEDRAQRKLPKITLCLPRLDLEIDIE